MSKYVQSNLLIMYILPYLGSLSPHPSHHASTLTPSPRFPSISPPPSSPFGVLLIPEKYKLKL